MIAPSILAADFGKLAAEVEMINQSAADWIHFDVMDGRFVPNISFGFPILAAVKKVAQKPIDVHLMIVEPELYLADFQKAGADVLTVHVEATVHLHRTLGAIRALGMKAGIAVNPGTSLSLLEDTLHLADVVCLMSVNPGFGGQKFIPEVVGRTRKLRQMIDNQKLSTLIEIDGGVNLQNAPSLIEAGANVLVAGSFVFNSANPIQTIQEMKELYK
ncbi:MAG: ribulose-phosphate 3-epimerase [Bacteroidia bacterium]